MGVKGKLRVIPNGHAVYCPGCEEYHVIYDSWQFNGDYDRPTFSPSLLVHAAKRPNKRRCHSFIKNGSWQFLSDCSHALKDQIVPLRDEESRDELEIDGS